MPCVSDGVISTKRYEAVVGMVCLCQYVSEVVIGAPYQVTDDLMDHFKVRLNRLTWSFFNRPLCLQCASQHIHPYLTGVLLSSFAHCLPFFI